MGIISTIARWALCFICQTGTGYNQRHVRFLQIGSRKLAMAENLSSFLKECYRTVCVNLRNLTVRKNTP